MIRLALKSDFEKVMAIYEVARRFMAETGNPTQWGKTYPQKEIIEEDIFLKRLYVFEEENEIVGAFVYFLGTEPLYNIIDGAWRDNSPYGVIHRVASTGKIKGMVNKIVAFTKNSHLRIDTHKDNLIMQKVLEKNGFYPCGTVYLENGEERIGYEKSSLK